MALRPEFSIMGGLAVATIIYAIHANATPTQADISALPANTPDIDRSERIATWTSAGVVAGISLIAKDPTIFILGSAAAVGLAWWTRHSNAHEGSAGKYLSPGETSLAGSANTGPAMESIHTVEMFSSDFAR